MATTKTRKARLWKKWPICIHVRSPPMSQRMNPEAAMTTPKNSTVR
ncbi:MAG: hypothetical protein P8Y75_08435 [Nitrospirota bacterium]